MTKYTFPIRINGKHTADAEVGILNHRIVGCDVTTVESYTLPLSDAQAANIARSIAALNATFDEYEEEAADSSRY